MKLFIFSPVDSWEYCGGGYVVIAYDWEHAMQNFQDDDHKLYKMAEDVPEGKDLYCWTLVDSFDVDTTLEPRVVLDDFNWA